MTPIKSHDLLSIYNNFLAIENIINYITNESIKRIQNNQDFLFTINFPFIGEIKQKNKQDSLRLKFTELSHFHRENTIISVVAEFERLIFIKINVSSVQIKDVVHNGYTTGHPMHTFRVAFVKEEEDIFNLTGFNKFLDSHPTTKNELKEIIEFRNYLAHGKRLKVGQQSNKTLEQIITILDNILTLL